MSTAVAEASSSGSGKLHFWLRKLHSLSGIVPVGGYVFTHIFIENSAIRFKGASGWNAVAEFLGGLPGLQVIEVVLLAGILFHGVYGIFIVRDARYNLGRYPKARNWLFFLQRITGLIAFVFIGYHFWSTRYQYYLGEFGYRSKVIVNAHWMHGNIFDAPFLGPKLGPAFYMIGVAASLFHLFNGIFNALISWGITVGPTSQRVSAILCTAAALGGSFFGLWVMWGFYNV